MLDEVKSNSGHICITVSGSDAITTSIVILGYESLIVSKYGATVWETLDIENLPAGGVSESEEGRVGVIGT